MLSRLQPMADAIMSDKGATDALQMLYRTNPVARDLSKQARAILVFPNIVKAGLVFGGSGIVRRTAGFVPELDLFRAVPQRPSCVRVLAGAGSTPKITP